MTEKLQLTPSPDQAEQVEGIRYDQLVTAGLEKSRAIGFDISQSIRNNYPENADHDLEGRERDVIEAASFLSESVELDAEFFDSPSRTILLMGVADSWVENQILFSSGTEVDAAKAEAEKAMLEDILLMAAGDTSGVVRSIAAEDPKRADRYMDTGEEDPLDDAREEFLESIDDPELGLRVKAVLEERGQDSFLEKVRQLMAIDPDTEQDFTVRVLKIGNQWELISSGALEKPQWPDFDDNDTPEKRERNRTLGDQAVAHAEANEKFAAPFVAAEEEYAKKFEDKLGPLGGAFVTHHADGRVVLTLRASQAYALVGHFADKKPLPEDDFARDNLVRDFHIVQHEYAHTQKSISMGRHIQLGLLYEERKAEHLSGDKHGYVDIKHLFTDIQMGSGVDLVELVGESVKQEDALSDLLAKTSNSLGFRTALLLMAAKPLPYDKNPEHARQFADLNHLVGEDDQSSLDMVVRDMLERKGDGKMQESAEKFINKQPDNRLVFIAESYLPYRKMNGLGHGTRYLEEALRPRLAKVRSGTMAL